MSITNDQNASEDSQESISNSSVNDADNGASVEDKAQTSESAEQGVTHTFNIGTLVTLVDGEQHTVKDGEEDAGVQSVGLVIGHRNGRPVVGLFDKFTVLDDAQLAEVQ